MPKASFWSMWFAKPRERFSLEELKHLCGSLEATPEINLTNKQATVETLRSIAELMIWGDQHEPTFFEFFLEKNVLGHFHRLLRERDNRSGDVAKQVLQTLSIMIQNLRSETSIFYLFSNNHINDIVQLGFDFEDEEVLGYYISFLKTISLKLNASTVQFFFQDNGEVSAFPLYSEALRFVNHKEGMVRTAVRTLTLNVFSIKESLVQDFVVAKPANNYFSEIAILAAEQCQALDRSLARVENGNSDAFGSLESKLGEIEDLLSYFNDIFLIGSESLSLELCVSLWEYFVGPVIFWPLLDIPCTISSGANPETPNHTETSQIVNEIGFKGTGSVRPVCALYILERVFHLLENPLLINAIVCSLLAGSQSGTVACERWCQHGLKPRPPDTLPQNCCQQHSTTSDGGNSISPEGRGLQLGGTTTSKGSIPSISPFAAASVEAFNHERNGYKSPTITTQELYVLNRESFSLCFTGECCCLGAGGVRALVALVDNPAVDPDVMDISGVLPYRRRVRRGLLMRLAGSQDLEEEPVTYPSGRSARGSSGGKRSSLGSDDFLSLRLPRLPEMEAKEFRDRLTDERIKHLSISSIESMSNGNISPQGSLASDLSFKHSASPRTKNLVDELMDGIIGQAFQETTMIGSAVEVQSSSTIEMTSGLCQLLLMPMLPASTMWQIAWLLNQLMPSSNEGISGRTTQQEFDALNFASASARAGVLDELRGMWCDALLPLVHIEWSKARQEIMKPTLEASSQSIMAWVYAHQSHSMTKENTKQEINISRKKKKKSLSQSAQAAVYVHHKVRRMVAMLQLKEYLHVGAIPESCGLPSVTEADLTTSEVRELCEVDLPELGSIQCSVAFAKGHEKSVYFSVYGLPKPTVSTDNISAGGEDFIESIGSIDLSQEDVSKLVPVVILAEPSSRNSISGTVLSVAPLLGTEPYVDTAHPKWLHLHVRPSVQKFVKAVQANNQYNRSIFKSWQSLVDGHWVLSFPNPDDSNNAKIIVQQHVAKIAALYCDILTPLLAPDVS